MNASLTIRTPEGIVFSHALAGPVTRCLALLIDLTGILDPEDERARIGKRLSEVEADANKSASKLGNEGFLAKAPAEVVEQERRRLAEANEEAAALAEQLAELG